MILLKIISFGKKEKFSQEEIEISLIGKGLVKK
jgi:hypothetical protein